MYANMLTLKTNLDMRFVFTFLFVFADVSRIASIADTIHIHFTSTIVLFLFHHFCRLFSILCAVETQKQLYIFQLAVNAME